MDDRPAASYVSANRALWDEWTGIHERSAFYDLEGFKKGLVRIRPYEQEDVGDVAGKNHGLGEIVTALAQAGLHIEFLREMDHLEWPHPLLVEGEDGLWRLPPHHEGELPLFFALKASKPA